MDRAIFLCCALVAVSLAACTNACASSEDGKLVVMSYNVENLFDAVDAGSEYPEFSVARGKWDEARYKSRLERLAAVAEAAAPGRKGPDILCLVEVENRGVLEALRSGPLKAAGYAASALVPSPGQAVNCGILSRYPIESLRAHAASSRGSPGRLILEAHVAVGERKLILFVCHWKSKIGGAEETEADRVAAAALVAGLARSALAEDPSVELLVCGDFNENPDEYTRSGGGYPTAFMPAPRGANPACVDVGAASLGLLVTGDSGAAGLRGDRGDLVLYSPWLASEPIESGGYSYVEKGEKERIDGFLLSPGLLDGEGLDFESFGPLEADFLVDASGAPVAYRSASGSGYSDHLPIILELSLSGE
jgi:endonuclease/exonuclease/phosphatase family metal-dependent hydrolase